MSTPIPTVTAIILRAEERPISMSMADTAVMDMVVVIMILTGMAALFMPVMDSGEQDGGIIHGIAVRGTIIRSITVHIIIVRTITVIIIVLITILIITGITTNRIITISTDLLRDIRLRGMTVIHAQTAVSEEVRREPL